jgi:hypothetical protein
VAEPMNFGGSNRRGVNPALPPAADSGANLRRFGVPGKACGVTQIVEGHWGMPMPRPAAKRGGISFTRRTVGESCGSSVISTSSPDDSDLHHTVKAAAIAVTAAVRAFKSGRLPIR